MTTPYLVFVPVGADFGQITPNSSWSLLRLHGFVFGPLVIASDLSHA